MLKRSLKRGLRRGATLLTAIAWVGLGVSGPAHAFSYATGDLIGIVVKNSTELIVNLGDASSFTTSSAYDLPSQFAGDLTSAKFIALGVVDTSDPLGNVIFTADAGLDVPGFDDPPGTMAGPIIGAYQVLDQTSNDKWFNRLATIGAPNGTTIFDNQTDLLVLSGTQANSYTQGLDLGTDKINQNMPFSTALLFGSGDTASGNLWTASVDDQTLAGLFTLDGVIQAHDNGDNTVTFSLVPEPGSLLLVGTGLLGLAVNGRRRKAA